MTVSGAGGDRDVMVAVTPSMPRNRCSGFAICPESYPRPGKMLSDTATRAPRDAWLPCTRTELLTWAGRATYTLLQELRVASATCLVGDREKGHTVRELFGHKDVKTTTIYTHLLNRGGKGVRFPADTL